MAYTGSPYTQSLLNQMYGSVNNSQGYAQTLQPVNTNIPLASQTPASTQQPSGGINTNLLSQGQASSPLESGMSGGQWATLGAGAASLTASTISQANRTKYINTTMPGSYTTLDGNPIYNLGMAQQQINQIDTRGVTGAGIAKGAAMGASAGSATGTPIGTAIGAVVGIGADIVGQLVGQSKARAKKRTAQMSLYAAQHVYNAQKASYNQMQLGQQQYEDQQNNLGRLNNLSTFTNPYQS